MWIKLFFHLFRLWLVRALTPKEEPKSDLPVITNQDVYTEIKETPPVPEIKEEIKTIIEPVATKLNIIQKLLPPNQYVQDSKFKPNSICLHHTNGHSWQSTYNYWNSDAGVRVATHFLIDRDGSIVQCIPLDKAWGFHININARDNKIPIKYKNLGRKYDMQSIGIELCSMSQVTPYNGKFLDTYGKVFKGDVIKLDKPFRGFEYFENYTKEQIDALKSLLLHLLNEYPKIKEGLYDNYENKFDINQDALEMKPGIFFHVSYRTGTKWDLYPHPGVIAMLNSLKPALNVVN